MKYLHNIEKSVFSRGEYVGYADGVWEISKSSGMWWAFHRERKHPAQIARKLETLSELIGRFSGT